MKMKITLEFYQPGEEFLTLPLLFITYLPIIPRFNIMEVYYKAVEELQKDPPRIFRNKAIALKPISLQYSTRTEGGVGLIHVQLPCDSYLRHHSVPQQIEGDYHVVFTVNYRFGCSCHKPKKTCKSRCTR